jgi:hypothetical protein
MPSNESAVLNFNGKLNARKLPTWCMKYISINRTYREFGSLGFSVVVSGFRGVSVRPHAHTHKSGVSPRQFLKSREFYNMLPRMV